MKNGFVVEYARYRALGEKAMAQVPDPLLNRRLEENGNSIAILVQHIGGNLRSRFTDFLSSDGEKTWRDRDREFVERELPRPELEAIWKEGWTALETEVAKLNEEDMDRMVVIRGSTLSVHEALCRSLTHTAYHVGQMILIARTLASGDWKWLSIPPGQSAAYNANPTLEQRPK